MREIFSALGTHESEARRILSFPVALLIERAPSDRNPGLVVAILIIQPKLVSWPDATSGPRGIAGTAVSETELPSIRLRWG